jgi:predicted ABC-type ATPase
MSEVFIIGGANGSGKTTAAMTLLPGYLKVFEFVNADEIARGLNPLKPETANIAAGKAMIHRIDDLIAAKKNFAFETTCAGRHHLKTIEACRKAGYQITLIYFWIPSAKMAIQRVRSRVKQGGHSIPEHDINRRYSSGINNLVNIYLPLVDIGVILNSSDIKIKSEQRIIAYKIKGSEPTVCVPEIWNEILANTKKG